MSTALSVCKSAYFFRKSCSSAKKYADLREGMRGTGRGRDKMVTVIIPSSFNEWVASSFDFSAKMAKEQARVQQEYAATDSK